jgi:hypothetical protein
MSILPWLLVIGLGALAGKLWKRLRQLETGRDIARSQAERNKEADISNPKNQMEAVTDLAVTMSPKAIMNKSEVVVFYAVNDVLKKLDLPKWHVFAQVSLGEILRSESTDSSKKERARQSINSKRCDVLVTDQAGMPRAAIEYQGAGHYQGTARHRDAVKKAALERAGVSYIEIDETFSRDQVRQKLEFELGRFVQMDKTHIPVSNTLN